MNEKKGFWQTMLEVINDANKSIEEFQKKLIQKKIDKMIKKDLKKENKKI